MKLIQLLLITFALFLVGCGKSPEEESQEKLQTFRSEYNRMHFQKAARDLVQEITFRMSFSQGSKLGEGWENELIIDADGQSKYIENGTSTDIPEKLAEVVSKVKNLLPKGIGAKLCFVGKDSSGKAKLRSKATDVPYAFTTYDEGLFDKKSTEAYAGVKKEADAGVKNDGKIHNVSDAVAVGGKILVFGDSHTEDVTGKTDDELWKIIRM